MWKWLIVTLAAGAAHAAAVRGAVVDNQSGRPLARSLVVVRPVEGTPGVARSVRTDPYGVFAFESLPAGAYLLSASRRAYAPMQYQQRRWKGSGVPLVLADSTVANLSLRLQRFGAISGIVGDEADVGLPGVQVAVYRNTRPPRLVTHVETDDRGVYRAGGLEPGSYLVRTLPVEEGETAFLPTFAPESTRIEGARAAEVALDRETTQVNLRPIPGRLYTVAGRVTDRLAAGVTVTLISDAGTETTVTGASGSFRFKPVAPGPYELLASAPADRRMPARAAWSRLQVEQNRDYNLSLGLIPELRVLVEDSQGRGIDMNTVIVLARRKDLSGESRPSALRFEGHRTTLLPGRWELSLAAGPDQYVAAFSGPSAAGGRADGWNEIVLEGFAPAEVKFVLASDPGAIHGVVSDAGKMAPGAPVFLEAFDPESRRRLADVRMTRTDVRGQYRFYGLAPGHYRVLSSYEWDDAESVMFNAANPKVVRAETGRDEASDLEVFILP